MVRRSAAVLLGFSLLAAGEAAAQDGAWYRQGVPEVLGPSSAGASAGTPAQAVAAFGPQYRKRGQPRVAVFWMRRLSDRTVPETRTVERVDETFGVNTATNSRTSGNSWGTTVPYWGRTDHYGQADASAQSSRATSGHRTLRREERSGPVTDESEDWLPEEVSLTAEAALLQELRRAGVKVVDRNTILRLQGVKDARNPQAVEAAALRGKADLLAEIVAAPSADSDTGVLYRVDVKDLRSGLVLASFTTPAEPRAGATAQFIAKPGRGYVESRSGTPLGQELAWELMEQLVAAWGR
jgi:hypothetical protein